MDTQHIARASIRINAPRAKVWEALVNPAAIYQYMFGTNVVSDWKVGSAIIWKGEWQGRSYEDKGAILQIEPGRYLTYSHFSPLSGLPDHPDNYHRVTVKLSDEGSQTHVYLSQDNNPDEQAREHSEKNWALMLAALKRFVEESV